MAQGNTPIKIKVTGAAETAAAFLEFDALLQAAIRAESMRQAGRVRDDIAGRASRYGDSVAAGIQAISRGYEAAVESVVGVTGDESHRRPNFGGLLWRHAFEPAADAAEAGVYRGYEAMIDALVAETGFE